MTTLGGSEKGAPSPERQARYAWAADLVGGARVLDAACGGGWGTEWQERAVQAEAKALALERERRIAQD